MADQSAAQAEVLLQKIVGGSEGEEKKEDQYFECKVMSTDVPDPAAVKKWIADLPRTTIKGVHIVARSPSLQLYAFEGEKKIVILKDWSDIEQVDATSQTAQDALKELNKVLDTYCPTPNQPK